VAIVHALARDSHTVGVTLVVTALDCSRVALEVARRNVQRILPTGACLPLLQGDLLSAVGTGAVDLVVANPPYLAPADMAAASPEVRCEPRLALEGGSVDGLGVVEELIASAFRVLRAGGVVVSEIGAEQEGRAIDLARAAGFEEARVRVDLSGKPRVLIARKG
jgi:release factor glutamine methyltransferase